MEEDLDSYKWCVLVFVDKIYNQCVLYHKKPTKEDLKSLREEFAIDEELGLVGVDRKKIIFKMIKKDENENSG